jgi:hypothetical protein
LRAVLAPILLCGEGMVDRNKKTCSFLLLNLKVSRVNSVVDAEKNSIKILSSMLPSRYRKRKRRRKRKELEPAEFEPASHSLDRTL